jgi:hypothetical protein
MLLAQFVQISGCSSLSDAKLQAQNIEEIDKLAHAELRQVAALESGKGFRG